MKNYIFLEHKENASYDKSKPFIRIALQINKLAYGKVLHKRSERRDFLLKILINLKSTFRS